MNRKIALMTWHHVENYGTALQALALKKVLESQGLLVDLIDYRRTYNSPITKRKLSDVLLENVRKFISSFQKKAKPSYKIPKQCFEDFYRNNFTYTTPCIYNQDFEKLNTQYDGFICGSDQIWGPEWFDTRYFLDFVTDNQKIISYAPSFGVTWIKDRLIEDSMAKLLKRFASISVREQTGCRIVNRITGGAMPQNVVDPVLLLTAEDWNSMIGNNKPVRDQYIFAFFLKNKPEYFRIAAKKAEMEGIPLKAFHCTQSEDNIYANVDSLTPFEFIEYIRSADYIYTDSYHVMLFSLIFNVPFCIFKKDKDSNSNSKNGRVSDLLSRLAIDEKKYYGQPYFEMAIDFNKINEKLQKLREDSISFIKLSIEKLPKKSTSSSGMVCPLKQGNRCAGAFSEGFKIRLAREKCYHNRCLLNLMKRWNFTLMEDCYSCQFFQDNEGDLNIKKPLFYRELNRDLLDCRMKLSFIFIEYYLAYDVPNRVKTLIKRMK